MKQTAVEYLLSYLPQIDYGNDPYYDEIIKKAKELEKRHIMDANTAGVNCGLYGYKNAEEYYKKTFTEPTRKQNDNKNITNNYGNNTNRDIL